MVGVFHPDENGYVRSASGSKDVTSFPLAKFTGRAGISAQVVNVNAGVFGCEAEADSVGGVAVDPAAVRDVGDYSLVSDAVGGPAERSQVGVVEAVLVRGGGALRIGFSNAAVYCRVVQISVEVIS